jgi:NAD(P)-dependent dehydrogenase (short-subunit alcohol dehydrogenase family)
MPKPQRALSGTLQVRTGAIAVKADVRVRDEVESMLRTVGEQLGSIDTLVLNAHIDTTLAPIINQSWEALRRKSWVK